jgi:hypothetical protein
MKKMLAAIMIMCSSMAWAEDRVPGIETTIQGQIDAFLVDDFARAFEFASPTIKRMFGSSERFGLMVRNGYPMVHRPADVEFLELRKQGPLLFQKVRILDAKGIPYFMEYNMIDTPKGWQIDGVELLAAPPVGA